jgi:ABC-2 type transport system ATP-binding protein
MDKRAPASLEIGALSFRYGGADSLALSDVGFRIRAGERVGLLGPNGAGKTTLMRIACGYLPVQDIDAAGHEIPARAGTSSRPMVRVGSIDVRTDPVAARRQVGYLPEQVPLYVELRVREHLWFRASIKGVRRRARAAEIARVADLTGLREMLEVPIHKLSRGYRQRVGIADALVGAPPLVVLDEPTVGLDPNQVQGIRAMLRDLGGDHTLVFSSHLLAEVEALCDRIIILARGRVAADESVSDAIAADSIVIEIDGDSARLRELVQQAWLALPISGAPEIEIAELGAVTRAHVRGGGPAFAAAVGRASVEARVPLRRLERGRGRLEERFARVTGAREEGGVAS